MKVINWQDLRPVKEDIRRLHQAVADSAQMPMQKLVQLLIKIILEQYPWENRHDLVELFNPTFTYQQEDKIAFLQEDPQQLRLPIWLIAKVLKVETVSNPVQGNFQLVHLVLENNRLIFAAGLLNVPANQPDPNTFLKGNIEQLIIALTNQYFSFLDPILRILVEKHLLPGKIVGDIYDPTPFYDMPVKELIPFFSQLTPMHFSITVDEICKGLSKLYSEFDGLPLPTQRQTVLAALEQSEYFYLGGDRWTTKEIYDQVNRPIQQGLPVPHIRSKIEIQSVQNEFWTDEDREDLVEDKLKLLPPEASSEEDEIDGDVQPSSEWHPPSGPIKLPTLSYLYVTQAYFPISGLMNAFNPQDRLIQVRWMDGELLPFLLDRDDMMLKAFDPESMRTNILGNGIPAGTYLWLEYIGPQEYRIAPRLLEEERKVPCKLATIEDGQLQIEHIEIAMQYEGDGQVFKAEMRFEDIEALFEEARQKALSVRDAIILAVQELCENDPENRAYSKDIFNAVFLTRMCSYNSVQVLLYTESCFKQIGHGYFRFDPNCGEAIIRKSKQKPKSRTISRKSTPKQNQRSYRQVFNPPKIDTYKSQGSTMINLAKDPLAEAIVPAPPVVIEPEPGLDAKDSEPKTEATSLSITETDQVEPVVEVKELPTATPIPIEEFLPETEPAIVVQTEPVPVQVDAPLSEPPISEKPELFLEPSEIPLAEIETTFAADSITAEEMQSDPLGSQQLVSSLTEAPKPLALPRSLGDYIQLFSTLARAPIRKDWARVSKFKAPHKAFLLLSVMDLITSDGIQTNMIEITPELIKQYGMYWNTFRSDHADHLSQPFFHLRTSGFWHLIPCPGMEETLSKTSEVNSRIALLRLVTGATLDDDLFQLLLAKDSRSALRLALIQSCFEPEYQVVLLNPEMTNPPVNQITLIPEIIVPQESETIQESPAPLHEDTQTTAIAQPQSEPILNILPEVGTLPEHHPPDPVIPKATLESPIGTIMDQAPIQTGLIEDIEKPPFSSEEEETKSELPEISQIEVRPEPKPALPVKSKQTKPIRRIWSGVIKVWKKFTKFVWRKPR